MLELSAKTVARDLRLSDAMHSSPTLAEQSCAGTFVPRSFIQMDDCLLRLDAS
jgi:hypothetical protein